MALQVNDTCQSKYLKHLCDQNTVGNHQILADKRLERLEQGMSAFRQTRVWEGGDLRDDPIVTFV